MKLASISIASVSLLVCFASMGCSSSPPRMGTGDSGGHPMDSGPVRDMGITLPDMGMPGHDTGPGHDSGPPGHDTGTVGHDTGRCTVHCTSDSACGACGTVTGGVYCCDVPTNSCFVSHSASCPSAGHDSGGGMSY